MTEERLPPPWDEGIDFQLKLGQCITTIFWVMDFVASAFAQSLHATILTTFGVLTFAQCLYLGYCRDTKTLPEQPGAWEARILWVFTLCQSFVLFSAVRLFDAPVSVLYGLIAYTAFSFSIIGGRKLP